MLVIGIDPGKDGAGVLLSGSTVLESFLTADLMLPGKGTKKEYSAERLWAEILGLKARHGCPDLAVLELPAGRPMEGAGSARTTGVGWGLWRMALAATGIPTIVPSSAKWTKLVLQDAPGEGKARAIHVAQSRVPGLRLVPPRCRVPHSGLADAACLALYGQLRGLAA